MKVLLAYSGGVDSAYLKWRLEHDGHEVVCVTLDVPDLTIPEVAMNRRDRCYHCKRAMFLKLLEKAREIGADCVMEGTNADDQKVYRPGIRALRELGIRSPLAEEGLTKADVRRLAREAGLAVSDKPSSPCLATRYPYDVPLTMEKLRRAAEAESLVREYLPGLANLRVRCEGEDGLDARIETDCVQNLEETFADFLPRLKALGFRRVEIDPHGFQSGSYDK